MPTTCLNCGAATTGNFCTQCGQKAQVKRLNWKSFWEEIFHFFTHIEKGFIQTSIQLVIRPGRLCKNYLDGKRKKYQKPVSFLMIWISFYLLMRWLSNSIFQYDYEISSSFITWDSSLAPIIQKYRSLMDILIMPITALISWLVVGRPKLNYVEILCVCFYLVSFIFIAHTIHIAIVEFVLGYNTTTTLNENIKMGLFIAWTSYACIDFYRHYNIRFLFLRVIISNVMISLTYFLVIKLFAHILINWGI